MKLLLISLIALLPGCENRVGYPKATYWQELARESNTNYSGVRKDGTLTQDRNK